MQPELLTLYKEKIISELKSSLGLKNVHEVPKLVKLVINCGIGSQPDRKQAAEDAGKEISLITGQKPVVTFSRQAISNFKLRAGEPVGLKVTLRGERMYDFLLRLVKTAMPRIRDFRGISPRGFDGRGNFTLGVTDHTIFPEIELDKVKRNIGFDVSFVTTAKTDDHGLALLRALGVPFRTRPQKSEGQKEEKAAA